MADLLDRTAQQVRRNRLARVHHLADTSQHPDGLVYTALCGTVMGAAQGALLTTQPADCLTCVGRLEAIVASGMAEDEDDGGDYFRALDRYDAQAGLPR